MSGTRRHRPKYTILALYCTMKQFNPIMAAVPLAAAAVAAGSVLIVQRQRTANRLERLGAAALETLLNAVDANDPITGAHVRRVARYALALADAMGLSERDRHSVERVALFHDIGKIHEALFDVIHDDHELTRVERSAINTHPERGATVLQPLAAFYPDLPEGVLAHHERWDGTGYSRGLAGSAIPLTARIVAIADTFDAITHARRYRPGRTFVVGRELIAEGRGTQFEPVLVDLFLSPPVQECVRVARHEAAKPPHKVARPRSHHTGGKGRAPDVSFRWRGSAPSRHEQDRAAQTTR